MKTCTSHNKAIKVFKSFSALCRSIAKRTFIIYIYEIFKYFSRKLFGNLLKTRRNIN